MKLIGLNGRLRSGKDTAVEYIRDAARPGVTERAGFADKMKLSGVLALGFDPSTVEEAVAIANRIKESGRIAVTWSILDPHPNRHEDDWSAGRMSVPQQVLRSKTIDGRDFWQRYGTEAHRDALDDKDFWVNALLPQPHMGVIPRSSELGNERNLRAAFPGIDVLCITDVRFANEAERILNLGGVVWLIDAEERLGPLPSNAHASEHPLPPEYVTITVPNNTTLEQFQVACRTAWELTNAHS